MDDYSLYVALGLEPSASLTEIKSAYRSLAKKCHPDRNLSQQATDLFQQLNAAYHTLSDKLSVSVDQLLIPADQEKQNYPLTFTTRENKCSITIDVPDAVFLALLEQCVKHYGVRPISRGLQHGTQLSFAYSSPGESET